MTMREKKGGFTLLEVLVSIAILGVVTSLGVQAFFGLTGAWRETRRLAELEVATQAALDRMGDTFATAIASSLARQAIQGERRDTTDPRFWDTVLANDRVAFPVYIESAGGETVPARVTFAVERDQLGNDLVRVEMPLDDTTGESKQTRILEKGDVLRLRFEYADPDTGQWLETWSKAQMPGAVRVSMAVAYRERIPVPGAPRTQIARKAVFPIRVH